jgi:hypothetical protein
MTDSPPDLVRGGVTVPGEERQPVECYTRIMGYYRRKRDANPGKQSEIAGRRLFQERVAFLGVQQDSLEV